MQPLIIAFVIFMVGAIAYRIGIDHGKRKAYRIPVSLDSHVKHELRHAERSIEELAGILEGRGTLESAIQCIAIAHLRLARVIEVESEITSQQRGTRRRLWSRLDKLRRKMIRQVNLLPKWENPPEIDPEPIDPEPDWEPEE